MSKDNDIRMRDYEGTFIANRYRLEKFLDEGAFGAVFKASHIAYRDDPREAEETDSGDYGVELRRVAIKIAKRRMSNREARRTFGDALMMARVADGAPDAAIREHFVAVYDAWSCPEGGPLAGHPYVVMELVEGLSLRACLKAGPFPLTRALAYFDQILKAMAFMHGGTKGGLRARGPIAHRDLKPSNILVTRRSAGDLIKVADFGLAVEVDSLLGWVESGGDLAYLAPESFSHNICSPQSDVYMLGLVFYEMLAGRSPFGEVGSHLRLEGNKERDKKEQEELRALHLTARHMEKFSLLESHEELRKCEALIRVIRTALQTDMNVRYDNAFELMVAWEKAKTSTPDPETDAEKPWEKVRRLTGEAEQRFRVGDEEGGESLLNQAEEPNDRTPDPMIVGRYYLLKVERLIKRSKALRVSNKDEAQKVLDEAGRLVKKGLRRKCRSTYRAAQLYFASLEPPSPQAASFEQKANECPDQE